SAHRVKGRRQVRTLRLSAGPWESPVGPPTGAALRILPGKVRDRGVLPPEAAFEPLRFLEEAARAGPGRPGPGRLLNESREPLKRGGKISSRWRIRLGRSGGRRTRFLGLSPSADQHDEEDR